MKTNKQNKAEKKNGGSPNFGSELKSRSEQASGKNNSQTPMAPEKNQTPAPSQPAPQKTIRPFVNFAERDRNRQLPTEKVLETLRRWMPRAYELAEVVGKWIWITFPEQPAERIRADLSQLGFHWNNTRKCWQHPCGETLPRGQQNPREKYTTYFPADLKAA